MAEQKFYVRRIECWGGTYLFCVADRETRRRVTKETRCRATADRQCKRRNDDLDRYFKARTSEYACPRV